MQSAFRESIAYSTVEVRDDFKHRWLQAGLNGFAYRLAHLCVSRFVAVIGVSTVFFFV